MAKLHVTLSNWWEFCAGGHHQPLSHHYLCMNDITSFSSDLFPKAQFCLYCSSWEKNPRFLRSTFFHIKQLMFLNVTPSP